jgi:hypothetical protein
MKTKQEKRVTFDGNGGTPHIWGDTIAYNGHYDGKDGICLYSISTNSTFVYEDSGAINSFWGDNILWYGNGGGWIYSISRNESYKIMGRDDSLNDPDMWENRIVGVRDGDIWLLEFTFPEEPDNGGDNDTPWLGIGGGVGALIATTAVVVYFHRRKR